MSNLSQLGTKNLSKVLLNFGWPAALSYLFAVIYSFIDGAFVGQWVGPEALAGVSVAGNATITFSMVGAAVGAGGSAYITQALGSKDKDRASHVFNNQILLVVCCILILLLVGAVFSDAIIALFGGYGKLLGIAEVYYWPTLFSMPFLALQLVGSAVIHSEGNPKLAMLINFSGILVNTVLDWILIVQLDMGVLGSAQATVASHLVGFGLILTYFIMQKGEVRLQVRQVRIDRPLISKIGGISLGVMASITIPNIVIMVANYLIFTYLQELGVTINSIFQRVFLIYMVFIIGIDSGLRPVVSYCYGAKNYDLMRLSIAKTFKFGMLIFSILTLVVLLFADYIVLLFTSHEQLLADVPQMLRIMFILTPFTTVQVVLSSVYVGEGNPKLTLLITIVKNLLVTLPLMFIMTPLFGIYGILYAFPCREIVFMIFLLIFNREDMGRLVPRLIRVAVRSSS